MTETKTLNEKEIKALIRQEISDCFKDIVTAQEEQGLAIKQQGNDIREIKEALLGSDNKYKTDTGLSTMIKFSYDYAKANTDSKLIERAIPAIEHFYNWSEGNEGFTKWDILEKVIDDFVFSKKMKLFFGIGSWAGIMGLISSVGGIIGFIVYLVNKGIIS